MTDTESEEIEQEEEPTDTSENQPEESGEQPEIDAEDMADFSAVAEEIEETAGEIEAEESDEQPDESDEETDSSDDESAPVPDGVSVGDIYCNSLGMAGALSRERFGTLEADERDEKMQEYADIARQIQIDEYVDQFMAESGGMDSLSPGQAVLLGTVMWGGMIMMEDPAMAEGITEAVRS